MTTAKVEKIDLVSKVTANGKIQAQRKVDMSALVMGQIVNLAVKEGDHVKKGQLLLQIDRAQLAAQAQGREASLAAMRHDLDAAKATAAQAKFDYERAKQNFKGHILAEADYQKAKSTLETSQANLAATEERMNSTMADLAASRDSLSKTTVTAPIEGIVTALPIKEGEVTVIGTMNNAGTQLMTVSDMGSVEAVMMVDETSVPQVKVGQKATLSIDAYPNKKFEGTVTEVGSSPVPKNDPDLLALVANSEAINFKVKIKLDNPPDTIRPGFSVTADIVTGRRDGATAIPIQALVVRDVEKKDKSAAGRAPRDRRGRLHDQGRQARLREGEDRHRRRADDRGRPRARSPARRSSPARSRSSARSRRATGSSSRRKAEQEGRAEDGMTTSELFRVSSAALTRHKLRAFLTLLGVIIGVATVVGVVSVISGLNSYVKDKVIGLNPDIFIFTKYGIITSREELLAARKRRDLTLTDMEVVRRECRSCAQVGARGERSGRSSSATASCPRSRSRATRPNMGEAMNFDIDNGRYFTEAEYDQRRRSPSSAGTSRTSCSRTSIRSAGRSRSTATRSRSSGRSPSRAR